jgi:hypothetical protein
MGDANDYSGSSPLNGSVTNAVSNDNGRIGKCYYFDGSGDYISFTGTSSKLDITGSISMAIWVKATNTSTSYQGLFLRQTVGVYESWIHEGKFMMGIKTGGGAQTRYSSTSSLSNNTWYHLCWTYDGSNIRIYINGALDRTISKTGSIDVSDGTLYIGYSGYSTEYLTGYANDARLYDHALSAKEVYDLSKGLVHWYKLNGDPTDSGPYGMNGTNGSSTAYSTTTKTHSQSWLNSDAGSNKEVTATNNLKNHITGDQTIAMWLYPTSFASRRNPYNKAYGGEGTITQETSGQVNYYHGTHGGDAEPYQGFTLTTPLTLNAWNHIALVRNNTAVSPTLKWYLNGSEANSVAANYALSAITTANLRIGGGYVSNYQGHISDLRVYGTALSAADISDLYTKRAFLDNTGNVKVYELDVNGIGSSTNLVPYYSLLPGTYTAAQNYYNYGTGTNSYTDNQIYIGATTDYNVITAAESNPWGRTDRVSTVNITANQDVQYRRLDVNYYFQLDNTKTYRFTQWVYMHYEGPTSGSNIYNYYGIAGSTVCTVNTTNVDSNPYFTYPQMNNATLKDKWVMYVFYVFPYNSTGNPTAGTFYFADGTSVSSTTGGGAGNYNSTSTALSNTFIRQFFMYQYNGGINTGSYVKFYRPRIDIVNGTEPTVIELVDGVEHRELIDASGNAVFSKKNIDSAGVAYFSDIDETQTLSSGLKQQILYDGTLIIDGEFNEVE